MKRTLVIVTYNQDRWRLHMLVRSIELYLTKCRIHIVYNENQGYNEWLKWFGKTCEPHLKNYKVKTSQKRDYILPEYETHMTDLQKCGWTDQQVLKIAVAQTIKTKHYLLLDSKNFFIKPCSVDSIPQINPSTIEWCERILRNWILMCHQEFGLKFFGTKTQLTANTTPYVVNTDTAKKLIDYFGGIEKFYIWFTTNAVKEHLSPAEFFLYEIFAKYIDAYEPGDANANIVGFWSFQIEDLGWTLRDYKKLIIDNQRWQPNISLSSFHGSLNNHLILEDVKTILRYLNCSLDIIPPGDPPFNGLHRKLYFDK